MKGFDKKVIMFVIGFSAGTFLMKKAMNKTNFNPPENFTIDHVQSMHNSQKFLQIKSDKFRNDSNNTSRENIENKSSQNINIVNKQSPYSSLMTGSFPDKKN
jgi:hypothetical protein